MTLDSRSTIEEVSKSAPCLHCGKPDWCYRLGDLNACKRGNEPAPGWEVTGKKDKDGTPYYAPAQLKKAIRPKATKEFFYYDRQGNPLVKVKRIDDGKGKRNFPLSHWDDIRQRWVTGVPDDIKVQVPIYRYQQVQKAISAGKTIYFCEGEGCADLLCSVGLQATTTIRGSDGYRSWGSYKDDLIGADIVICPDRDKPGLKYAEEIEKDFPSARWLYAPPGDFYWQHLPESKGLDVVDWINGGATVEDIKAAIGAKKYGEMPKVEADRGEIEHLDFSLPEADEIFTQKAQDALFGDTRWISLNGHMHRWNGSHYDLVPDAVVKANIARWCNSTPVQSGERWKYNYAKSSFVENIWNWVVFALAIDPALINPPGINCLNGTVKLHWEGKKVSWQLQAHNPDEYYIHTSQIHYDPKADATQCDRLLACLDASQQDIFLKTLAASLDLATVRRYRGREVKALLCQGYGSNGKDSLREAASYLYCSGMTAATVSDFASYDQGRKFTLAKLEGSLINWSSENSSFKNIDGLQSLKAAITGDPLDVERKRQDERPMLLNTVFLFNINEAPSLQAGLEAIQSRWAVLSFNKTYKVGADSSKGELEADGRFRYDPHFLQTEVVPALLNKILAALPALLEHGIDYRCTRAALESIQQETNHLWAFAREVKLEYRENGKVYINELWERLKEWYLANGTLSIFTTDKGKEQQEWYEQVDRRDKNVKAANQIYQRFSELFPKISRGVESGHHPTHPKQSYLIGINYGEGNGEGNGEGSGEGNGEGSGEGNDPYSTRAGTLGRQFNPSYSKLLKEVGVERFLEDLEPTQIEEIFLKVAKLASQPSHPLHARLLAFPTAFPTAFPLPSQVSNPAMNFTQSSTARDSTNSEVKIETSNNTNKVASDNSNFFTPAPSYFKEGDRCKAKRPFWGVPYGKICTIIKINNNGTATVSFKGCTSPTGSDVPLGELELVQRG